MYKNLTKKGFDNTLNYKPLYYNSANLWFTATILFLVLFFPHSGLSKEIIEIEEFSVSLNVQEIGTVEVPALINNHEEVYLPVNYIFSFLKIKSTISTGMDTVIGFFLHPEEVFLIDNVSKTIYFQDNVTKLRPNDLIRTENNLYLKTNYFGDVFGLMCTFNFRSLSVNLKTKIELPVIREMRLKKMRDNINRLVGKTEADTIIRRDFKLFHFGMANWAINNINYLKNNTNNTRLSLSLGGIIAGGETKATLNYAVGQALSEKNFNYFWRYVNNKNQLLRQVRAGNVYTRKISTIYAPIVGLQLTNTPTSFRRSFGYHTISDYTKPGWTVELYINNVLVDYVKADDTGFFTFDVPLIYGNTELNLRFYGPWGEELSKTQYISIPYNFLPSQEFEYTTTAGVLEDQENSIFARTNLNYGVSRYLTVGGGVEYLSSLQSQKVIPFLKTSLSLTSNLLLFGEFAAGVKTNAILSYRTHSNLQFELNYTIYDKEQKAINTNRLEERKATISMPLRLGTFNLYSRFKINQIVLPNNKYTNANLLFSGSVFGINTNFTTNAVYFDNYESQLYSNLALSFRLPKRFVIRPQMRYDYMQKKVSLIKVGLEKQFFKKLNLNLLVENNFLYDYFSFQFGLRYELPFARTSSSVSSTNGTTTLYQSANGSFMYDGETDYFGTNNRESVGRSGIVLLPYLDINGNNKRERNEPKVSGLEVRINGGRIKYCESDTTIRISDLEPYRNYLIELAGTGFDYIAWKIKNQTINITINPNQFKLIEIPIAALGEVSGFVYFNNSKGKRGQGRILVDFYNSKSILVAKTLSEDDGYFSYLGFKSGSYRARIDSNQLNNLKMISLPQESSFEILTTPEGDLVEGLEFVLENTTKDKKVIEGEEKIKDNEKIEVVIVDKTESTRVKTNQGKPQKDQTSFDNVIFKFDSDKLSKSSKEKLDKVAKILTEQPNIKLVINGHTDNVGSKEYNQKLSERRAESGKNYLISKGIDKNRLLTVGFGENSPIAENTTKKGRRKNRRIEIKTIKSDINKDPLSFVHIYFKFDSDKLTKPSKEKLNKVVEILMNQSNIKLEIQGHTDNVGSKEYNQKLSERRANSVRNYLILQGINGNRLITIGFGESTPIANNITNQGKAKNRRVEFKVRE